MSAGRLWRWQLSGVALVGCLALGLLGAGSALAAEAKFSYTGAEQEFTVPAGVTSIHVVAVGSEGGTEEHTAAAGSGAIVSGKLTVKPGQKLYVEVGGVPFNGGGIPIEGASGGGASDVRTVSIGAEPSPGSEESLKTRLLVAGGGGAGGSADPAYFTCPGGAGGAAGKNGANATGCPIKPGGGGAAGTASKGGKGGTGYGDETESAQNSGEDGRLGVGGNASGGKGFHGAGGGGGLFGGGGGGLQGVSFGPSSNAGEGGGGGGSNLVPPGGTAKLANPGATPSVSISYTEPASVLSLQQDEESGFSSIAVHSAIGGYIAGATLSAGTAKETCPETNKITGGELLKNKSTTDEIEYPAYNVISPNGTCSGALKLQKTEAGKLGAYYEIGASSATKGAILELKAAENAKTHIYPATFKASLAEPFAVELEEYTVGNHLFICNYTDISLSGSHTPQGEAGIESATVKATFKRTNPEPTTCPKSLTVAWDWIPYVPSDSFNPYMYGFIEP